MQAIKDILPKEIVVKKSRETEYGQLQSYFLSLGMKDKNGRGLSRGAIGFLLMPLYRSGGCGLVHDLKSACERSDNPAAVFWHNVRIKK